MKIIIAFFAFLLIPFSNFSQIQAGFAFDDSICVGDCIFFQDTSVGLVTSYNWSFIGGTPSASTAVNPGPICFTTAGTYNISLGIIGSDGPSAVTHTILVGNYMDSMDVSNDTLIEMGGAAYLAANGFPGGGTYNWIPNDIFECPNCPETVGSPLIPTNAIVQYISPEGCASILWKSADKADEAAAALGLTADKLRELKLVDAVIKEPLGGAHRDVHNCMQNVKQKLEAELAKLEKVHIDDILQKRYNKLMMRDQC